MQTDPEGGIQNNKGWVSVLVADSHPSCVSDHSGLNPYPVLKVAFPVILSQQCSPDCAELTGSVML